MKALVLAGGKGKRLHSQEVDMPKALREILGKPLIRYVLDNLSFLSPSDICIVVGFQGEKVMAALGPEYTYVEQKEQLGTGHAVLTAEEALKGYDGDVMVFYGDMPLISSDTIRNMIRLHQQEKAAATLLTANVFQDPPVYGRIIRDREGELVDIVELKDCTPQQAAIPELNVGSYVFQSGKLFDALHEVGNQNAQGEYLLTDVPRILLGKGERVVTYTTERLDEIYGVNTPEELELCTRLLLERRKGR
ncbi:MAG: NTP transferase domain-containing protein [Clostridia bacterium]|jgi:UDP-N-acetylglucosamine diphosphorylase/glucosamine-1-phosphate N-acetyltransferase